MELSSSWEAALPLNANSVKATARQRNKKATSANFAG